MTNRTLPDWNVKSSLYFILKCLLGNRTLPDWNVKFCRHRLSVAHQKNRTLPDWNVKKINDDMVEPIPYVIEHYQIGM